MNALGLISVGLRGFLSFTTLTCLLLMVYLSGRDAAWRKWVLGSAYALCWVLFFLVPEAGPLIAIIHFGILLYISGYLLFTAGDVSHG